MLGRLLRAWDARPGPSVVAVTSDHGEAFGEHGEESHGLFVYDTTLRVPLVLRGAGLPAARRVADRVSLADLPTTLAELAGAEAMEGRSLARFTTPESERTRSAALRRDAGAAPRLRLERAAELAGGPLQVHPRAAARALRPHGRPWRDAQPRGDEPGASHRGSPPRSTRSWFDWATRRAGAGRIPRPPSGCARSDTCRARKAAARARIRRTGSRWRVSSRGPSGRSRRRRS